MVRRFSGPPAGYQLKAGARAHADYGSDLRMIKGLIFSLALLEYAPPLRELKIRKSPTWSEDMYYLL